MMHENSRTELKWKFLLEKCKVYFKVKFNAIICLIIGLYWISYTYSFQMQVGYKSPTLNENYENVL